MSSDIEAGPGTAMQARQGLRITFRDLTYTVDSNVSKGEKVTLLNNVSGYLEPYKMTALMGPSGSGKTTLLDILAGRKSVGSIAGDIRFGGMTPSPAFLRRYTGYVEQFDTLIGSLTVKEMLMYTAELKRPRSEPYASKAAAVSQLLTELGLDTCKDVRIGDNMNKGISGGQAKRANIGIALISDPRVLFLDEPTSGLDSFSANEVVELVRGLSQSGVTVVATIHSPSATAFSMFDRILLLARGNTCYFGPQGDAPLLFAKQHWPGASGRHETSIAEFIVDSVTELDRAGRSQLLADAYNSSELRKENDAQLAVYLEASPATSRTNTNKGRACRTLNRLTVKLTKADQNSRASLTSGATAVDMAAEAVSSEEQDAGNTIASSLQGSTEDISVVVTQFATPAKQAAGEPTADGDVLKASMTSLTDEVLHMSSQLQAELSTRNSTSTPWWWALWVLLKYRAVVNYKNPAWVMPRMADKFLFAFIILTLYLKNGDDFSSDNLVNLGASLFMWTTLPAFGAVAYVPSIVLERRLFLRERADGLYLVGTYFIAKMVEELVLATIISVIFSAFVFYGVAYQGSFALFWLVYLLVLANGIAIGYLVAALAPNLDVANAALPAYVTTLLFFAGQLATFDSIPKYWRWYSYINLVRYSWTSLMSNQFHEQDPEFANNQSVLQYYGMEGKDRWANMSYLFAFFAVFATLAYLALAYMRHAKR